MTPEPHVVLIEKAPPATASSPRPKTAKRAKAKTVRRSPKTRAKATKAASRWRDAPRLLQGLHASWQEAVEAHRLRVEGQFKLAESALRDGHRAKAKDVERVRAALKVRVKPRKGRAKDLRRVEEALDGVLSRVGSD